MPWPLKFAQGDYLTDGKRLVYVLMVLPHGEVLVEDVGKRHGTCAGEVQKEHIEAVLLNLWYTPVEWAKRASSKVSAHAA
jgi:hypothetical protein